MVIFEDLHWIDDETQAFLNLLADSIGTARILLLVNYRPEYSHEWGSKTYYTQLRLDPLGKESADEMLSALLGDGAELTPLKRLIIERTEGNPFFMEETVQVLFDEGALVRNGRVKLTKPLSELKIPPTVQAILAARIDRLPRRRERSAADARGDRQESSAQLGPRESTRRSGRRVERMLADLQLAEFIYEQPAVGDIEYIFKHALTQEVAYNSVLIERRKCCTSGRRGAGVDVCRPARRPLGRTGASLRRSGNADKAVEYLGLSGNRRSSARPMQMRSVASPRRSICSRSCRRAPNAFSRNCCSSWPSGPALIAAGALPRRKWSAPTRARAIYAGAKEISARYFP